MKIGPFFVSDPIGLTLTSDSQIAGAQKDLDIVWQLRFDEAGPIHLYSTLGLQAQSLQIFPQFSLNKAVRTSVGEFFSAPRLELIYGNFARLVLTPFEDMEAIVDFWVRDGGILLGRFKLTNHSEQNHEIGARLAANLVSLRGTSDLKHSRQGYQTYLKGSSGNLTLNLTLDGLAKTVLSPNAGLEQTKQLTPNQNLQILWQAEIHPNVDAEHSRHGPAFPLNWEAEVARLDLANQGRRIQVSTPHNDWDAVLFSNQNQSFQLVRVKDDRLVVEKTRGLHTVNSEPQNQSALSSNSRIHALELWQLIMSLLPAQTQLSAEIFAQYLAEILEVCSKESRTILPFPCLVNLGWKIHQLYQQKDYLQAIYPALLEINTCWFDPTNDRDQDGLPEWRSTEQARFDSINAYDLTNENSFATRISFTESFGLAYLLHFELETLQSIANILEDQEGMEFAQTHLEAIHQWLQEHEAEKTHSGILDYQTHQAHQSQLLFDGELADFGKNALYLSHSARLNFRLKPSLMLKKPTPFTIIGENAHGDPVKETVASSDLLWLPASFFLTTQEVYQRIDRIEGLTAEGTNLQLYIANLNQFDISYLFGEIHAEDTNTGDEQPADSYLKNWLNATSLGIPLALTSDLEEQSVSMGWNSLLISYLIEKDERDMAFNLFSQLMRAQISLLKTDHANSERWHPLTGRSHSPKNSVAGLLPIQLFLDLAGIHIFGENKVRLSGNNPFPWQIRIQYRGLEVVREGKNATVRFPNGTFSHHFGSSTKTFLPTPSEPQP